MSMPVFLIVTLLFSHTLATIELSNLLNKEDPVHLPEVDKPLNASDPNSVAKVDSSSKPENFIDKLGLTEMFKNKIPCLGAASLKAGHCMQLSDCAAEGGFHDGKGLCLMKDAACCVKPIKCGEISLLNETVMANEGFPKGIDTSGDCKYVLKKPLGVAAVKLIIEDLELMGPDHKTGECNNDAFWVEGTESKLGKICGINRKTHLFFPTSPLLFNDVIINVKLASISAGRRWLIRADFIKKDDPALPPPECTQYYTTTSGLVTSLNFDLSKQEGLGNIDKLNYRICIKQAKGFCQIQMIDRFFDMGQFSSHGKHFLESGLIESNSLAHRMRRQARSENEESLRRLQINPSSQPARINPGARPNRPFNYRPLLPSPPPVYPNYGFNPMHSAVMPYMPIHEHLLAGIRPMMTPYNNMYHHLQMMPMFMNPMFHPMFFRPEMMKFDDKFDKLDKLDKLELLNDKLGFDKLDGKLGLDKLDGKLGLDKLDKFGGKIDPETGKLVAFKNVICPESDIIVLPIPDDGTASIHCGQDLHFGDTFTSSFPPYQILVLNKGKIHGKGFALEYTQLVC